MLKSFKAKLIGVFALLLVIIAGNSIWAVINFNELGNSIDDIMQANYRSVVAAQNMMVAIERQDSAQLTFLNEQGKNDKAEDIFSENEKRFLTWLSRAEDNITEEGEPDILEQINTDYVKYLKSYSKMTSLHQSEGEKEARAYYYETILPYFEAIKDECRQLLELNQNKMVELKTEAEEMAKNASTSSYVIAIVAILLGLIGAFYLVNRMIKPIRDLIEKMKKISEGDYSQKLEVSGDNEISELAVHFNEMSQKLRTYKKLNVEKIMKEKQKAEAIVESISDGIIVTGANNEILLVNAAAERIFSIKEKEAYNRHFLEVVNREEIFDIIEKVKKRNSKNEYKKYTNITIDAEDDSEKHYRININPIRDNNKNIIGVITLIQDITKLKEVDDLKSEFVSTVSHEFRTPLTSITMAAGLLLDEIPGNINEEQKELVDAINEDGKRLSDLVSELLDLSRIESGKMQMEFKKQEIKKIVDYATKPFEMQLKEKQINLKKSVGNNLSNVKVDFNKIAWVLTNLIGNALRYTPTDGSGVIEISARETANKMIVFVSDNGKGIPEDSQKKIFDKFVRADNKDEPTEGTGLGLAISKEIVKAHGGEIWVESKVGEGSTFYFTINLSSKDGGHRDG